MSQSFDVAIVGLGAMGSAAAYHFARRGARVLGLDRFSPPHALGSSHGETRIIREAYFEDPRYVPIVQRAYALWAELEQASGEPLMVRTGGLMVGIEDGAVVRGAQRSAEAHRLPFERLDAKETARRFPALRPRDDMMAIWEPRAGVLFPESCVRAHLALAAKAGATLRVDEPVRSWRADGGGYEVVTDRGRYRAGALVLAANAWLDRLLPGVDLGLTVTRQVLFWFEPRAAAADFGPDRLPIHVWEPERGRYFYGFPAFGGQVKVATHGGGLPSDPDHLDREVREPEIEAMRARLAAHLPDANGRFARAVVCMYANTPDEHFIIDRHPAHPRVMMVSACSGHGFKFSAVIGEIVADRLLGQPERFDLGLFRMRAPARPSPRSPTGRG
jgi:sarcosine oxidase